MKIFFSVGEPSGDLHASNLIRRLQQQQPGIECVGYGGPKMAAAGCQIHFDLTQLAVMFIAKVLVNIRTFWKLIADADRYLANNDVTAVVLIDYSGFNWWIARKAKKHGIPVFYYGVPQVWAWGPWRIRKIRKFVDHVLCKLPFEQPWFEQRNCHAVYVGHPYFDQLHQQVYDDQFLAEINETPHSIVTLLPGSRDQEVEKNLPLLIESARHVLVAMPTTRIMVACYNQRQLDAAEQQTKKITNYQSIAKRIEFHVDRTPELMKAATVCLACSGSVSLELMFHRKPTVIVYKIAGWAMWVQSLMIRVRFITLVNLIATDDIRKRSWAVYDPDAVGVEMAVMPEYLTSGNPAAQVAGHAIKWLKNPQLLQAKIDELDELARRYAQPGATQRAADYLLQELSGQKRGQIALIEMDLNLT